MIEGVNVMDNEVNNNSNLLAQQNCNGGIEPTDAETTDTENRLWPPMCPETGELIRNGGMEEFEGGVPKYWKTTSPCSVTKVMKPGRVHSGDSCVGLCDMATLSQIIKKGITPNTFFRCSFFAQLEGTQACLVCTLTFLKGCEEIPGGSIKVRGEDIPNCLRQFGYYPFITCRAPWGVTGAKIEFHVKAKGCQQVNIDDVSCSAQ
jgi:hypothetical protein